MFKSVRWKIKFSTFFKDTYLKYRKMFNTNFDIVEPKLKHYCQC